MRAEILAACCLALVVSTTTVRADDQTTCVDAFTQSQTLREQNRLVKTRDLLRTCARRECSPFLKGRIVKECTKWLAEVENALPSIVFDVKDGKGNDLSAVNVTIDGQPFTTKVDGAALPVDPGEHRFTFDDADGLAHSEKTIVIGEGEKDRHVSIVLGAPSGAPPPAAASPSDGSTQRTIGLVVGGVGVAGVVVGSIFGGMALSGSPCNSGNKTCATQADHDTLVAHETIANIGLGVGLVGLVVGGYLFLTAPATGPPSEQHSASISPWIGWGAAGITGTFQ